jgi:mannose-6-phosphate isomerase-like protein (cupin superfamily)
LVASVRTFELQQVLQERARANRAWLEFLRVPALSAGIYHLKAGEADLQKPHTEDEIYYVVSGHADFRSGQEQRAVQPGSLIFVERGAEHRFCDVTEDLTVLVFFGPAEGSGEPPPR